MNLAENRLQLKTGLLLRAASVGCSGCSPVCKPVFLYALPAGPAGVHGHGSARTLPRGPAASERSHRRAKQQVWGGGVGEEREGGREGMG